MQRPTPSPATDAGFLYGRKEYKVGVLEKLIHRSPDDPKLTEDQKLVQNAAIVAEKELLAMQRITQIFVVRCVGFFLFSVALFNVLAFFEASTTQERVPCALSVVVNLVAAMHYRTIAWIRMDSSLTMTLSAYATDATRYGEWLITLVFLTRKIYFYINLVPFEARREFFLSVEAAVSTSVLMIGLGALARLGTDEMWDWRASPAVKDNSGRLGMCFFFGVIPFLGSLACMILLLVDMTNASYPMEDAILFRSFFLVWIVYPAVALLSAVSRQSWFAVNGQPPLGANMLKDLAYGLADAWTKGVFGLWTAHAVFGMGLFGSTAAPYAWASPSPPPVAAP